MSIMRLPSLSQWRSTLSFQTVIRQRLQALFLCAVIAFGALSPTAYALLMMRTLAAADAPAASATHKTSTEPSTGTINTRPAPAPSTSLKQSASAAANAVAALGGKNTGFLANVQGAASGQPVSPAATSTKKPTFTP